MNKEEKQKNREEWGNHVAEWEKSGLTQAEYCRRSNLKTSKLLYWSRKFSEKHLDKPAFVQVQMPAVTRLCTLRIEIGNRFSVEVGNGYDPGALEHIVSLLSRT